MRTSDLFASSSVPLQSSPKIKTTEMTRSCQWKQEAGSRFYKFPSDSGHSGTQAHIRRDIFADSADRWAGERFGRRQTDRQNKCRVVKGRHDNTSCATALPSSTDCTVDATESEVKHFSHMLFKRVVTLQVCEYHLSDDHTISDVLNLPSHVLAVA